MASIKLKGDTSGEITISAPAVAGTTTLELPATSSTLATQNALGVRNLIINGDMRIAQRGTSVAGITGTGYYTCDRFKTSITNGGTWTQTQSTDVPSGYGFANSLKMQCTTADTSLTSTDQIAIDTRLEGQNLQHLKYGTSNAEKLTVSFWVKSNKTGTQTFELQNVSGTFRSISSTYTIDAADTWEKKTITCDGDTVGTLVNNNTLAIVVKWWFGAGSSFTSGTLNTSWAAVATADRVSSSNVNLADSTSNYINITGVQLEVGGTATPFEHRPYDMELARCQRYCNRFGYPFKTPNTGRRIGAGQVPLSIVGIVCIPTPVTMRAEPTFTWSDIQVNDIGTNQTVTSISTAYQTNGCVTANFNVASGLTVNRPCNLRFNSTSAYIQFDAEL